MIHVEQTVMPVRVSSVVCALMPPLVLADDGFGEALHAFTDECIAGGI